MAVLVWDQVAQHFYETGVDRGVLYIPTSGIYDIGYAWNGLTKIAESPSGGDENDKFADNMKYLSLLSVEEFGGDIEAFTYPDAFCQCDGSALPSTGLAISQQPRKKFGLSYRTRLGNDESAQDYAYKLHLVYGAYAKPSKKDYMTINDTPEAIAFSWAFTTVPVPVTGYKPTAMITVDSSKVGASNLTALENALYGTAGTSPRLPLPDEVITMMAGSQTLVTPVAPTFVSTTGVITIPTVTGVTYRRADTNAIVTGTTTIAGSTGASLIIRATPSSGAYAFTVNSDDDWSFVRTA